HEAVGMRTLEAAGRGGRLEVRRQRGPENLKRRRRLLETCQLGAQGGALRGGGFEPDAHQSPPSQRERYAVSLVAPSNDGMTWRTSRACACRSQRSAHSRASARPGPVKSLG